MFPMEAQLMASNILLVDDSNVVKAVLFRILTQSSLPINQIYDAANGAEALEILESHRMDLVVADINMPVMDGVEMIEWMRADTRFKHIPVIVISSEGSTARIEQLKAKGAIAFIRKPATPDLIRDIVCDTLGLKAPQKDSGTTAMTVFSSILETYASLIVTPLPDAPSLPRGGPCRRGAPHRRRL